MSFYARFSASGALASLEKLFLSANGIGDEGMSALAKAITPDKDGKGALPKCTTISMGGNPASDEAKTSVKRALKDRWLDGDFIVKNLSDVESLDCSGLGWGDAEMLKLASAIEHAHASGALASLTTLVVDDEEHPALKIACQARGIDLQ